MMGKQQRADSQKDKANRIAQNYMMGLGKYSAGQSGME